VSSAFSDNLLSALGRNQVHPFFESPRRCPRRLFASLEAVRAWLVLGLARRTPAYVRDVRIENTGFSDFSSSCVCMLSRIASADSFA
jgi:hypothetical protein